MEVYKSVFGGLVVKKIVSFLIVGILLFFTTKGFAEDLKISIKDAISIYNKSSRIVKIYKSEQEAKQYLVEKAKSLNLPSIDLDVSYNFLNDELKSKTPFGNLPIMQDKYLKGQLTLSHIIYDFGARDSVIKKALLDKNITALYLKKELNDGAMKLSLIVNQILLAKKILDVYMEELNYFKEQKKRIEGFYSEGLVTKNEVLQIDVEISNTEQKILTAKNNIVNLKEQLKVLLNIKEDISVIDYEFDDALAYKDKAIYENRPEVLIAQRLVMLKELELQGTEADRYPKFYGSTGLNYEENKYRTSDQNFFVSLGFKVNLFDGSRNLSERLSLLKARQEFEEKVRQTKDLVKLDVVQAINDLKTAKNKVEVSKQAITQAKENLTIEQGRYEEQLISVTDLIAAALRLSRANLNYHDAIYGHKNAYLRLMWAKGELYKLGEEKNKNE